MIEQQYYTRAKKGVFSKTPGYDTIAKSEGLEDAFIQEVLHPLCFYEAPSNLAGEENKQKYPKAFFCVPVEEEVFVIGQSTFGGKDYTGQRNRYFTHTYVLPSKERDFYLTHPEKMIYVGGFVEEYPSEGSLLPTLPHLLEDTTEVDFQNLEEVCAAIGMEKALFKTLLYAFFEAGVKGKSIYIVLDGEITAMSKLAKGILKYVYRGLPYEVRSKIGFITYLKEPKSIPGIHCMFLPKGSIKSFTTEIKAGYVFDFAKHSFHLEDLEENAPTFMDFILQHIEDPEKIEAFFQKAKNILKEKQCEITSYEALFLPEEKNLAEGDLKIEYGSEEEEISYAVKDTSKGTEHSIFERGAFYVRKLLKKIAQWF